MAVRAGTEAIETTAMYRSVSDVHWCEESTRVREGGHMVSHSLTFSGGFVAVFYHAFRGDGTPAWDVVRHTHV